MKYIKLFENFPEYKYEIGDYIRLKDDKNEWRVYLVAKIIDLNSTFPPTGESPPEPDYRIETFYTYHLMKGEITKFWVEESEIEGLATPEEIEDYELRIAANKYNL